MTTQTQQAEMTDAEILAGTLSEYADQTAADMDEPRANAIAVMADDAQIVADDVGCTVEEVRAWAKTQQ